MSPVAAGTTAWTLPAIAPAPGSNGLAAFGLFDDEDTHELAPLVEVAPTRTAAPATVAAPTPAAPAATTPHHDAWDLPNRPAWDLPGTAQWEAPEAHRPWAPQVPTAPAAPMAPASLAEPADVVESPATLADVVAAVRGRETAPWAADEAWAPVTAPEPAWPSARAAAPATDDAEGFLLDDVVTTTAFPRPDRVDPRHQAHDLSPREQDSPLAAIVREQDAPAPVAEADTDPFDPAAFEDALQRVDRADEAPPEPGRTGRARRAERKAQERAARERPARERAAQDRPAIGKKGRGRKAEQAAVFERMVAPRPGTGAPVPVAAADDAVDPLVIDGLPTPTPALTENPAADRGRTRRSVARDDAPQAPSRRRRNRKVEENPMLDRLQGRFPVATDGAPTEPAPEGDLELHGSPTLEGSDRPAGHGWADDDWSTAPTDDDREATPGRGGIFSKTPAREDAPLTGGKALALRILAAVCIVAGLAVGWRTLNSSDTETTVPPTPSTIATLAPVTVVTEAPTVPADVSATPFDDVTDPATVDPSMQGIDTVDPNAATAADPTATPADGATADTGDFFEPPKDYSAR